MIQAVFFDFFGVIMPDLLDEWLHDHGYTRSGRIADAATAMNRGELKREALLHIIAEETGIAAEQIRKELEQLARLDREVIRIIERVHSFYVTALISNASSAHIHRYLDKFSLYSLFDHIIISSEVGAIKPEQNIYKEALDRANVPPEAVVFTDDRSANVQGAHQANIDKAFVFDNSDQLQQDLRANGVMFD